MSRADVILGRSESTPAERLPLATHRRCWTGRLPVRRSGGDRDVSARLPARGTEGQPPPPADRASLAATTATMRAPATLASKPARRRSPRRRPAGTPTRERLPLRLPAPAVLVSTA